ncbi:hypothetical protein LCGC14_2461590 [marine sediment metagenome]|uniref:Uncharacterized protein n=1 Tax=marine sediment metagenome TaxID=412755 RepID=A0A0F9BDR5_9ZZZZ
MLSCVYGRNMYGVWMSTLTVASPQQVDSVPCVERRKYSGKDRVLYATQTKEQQMIEVTIEHLEQGKWVPQDIKLDVDADMALSDETLDEEMYALPRKIAYYAEISAELHAVAARRKSRIEAVEADVAQDIRISHAASGIKITEPAIKEKIAISQSVASARNAHYAADAQYRKVDGFYRALREKASLSIALCYKQKAEISAMSSSLS